MPIDPNASIEVTAFGWVPEFARGQVRDLRVRWALEELALPYRTRLLMGERPAEYYREQPWGQVPVYKEGRVELFECGAIALHIAEKNDTLLPSDARGRSRAIAWLFAALNSIDGPAMAYVSAAFFNAGQPWSEGAAQAFGDHLTQRLARLGDWLGDKEWLEDRFTVGDLMMVATIRGPDVLKHAPANVQAYVRRGEDRPAFQRALAAQLADFQPDPA
ncbi:MAG: glutathione S-transferase family protein [Novosphingobium sp.]